MKVIKRENDYHNTLRIINPDKPTIVVCKHEPYISSFFYKIQQENSDAVISELVIKVDNISISNISRNNKDFQDACGRAMYSPQCELLQFDNTEEYNDWLKGIQKAEKERQIAVEQQRLEKLYQQHQMSTATRYLQNIPTSSTSTFYYTR